MTWTSDDSRHEGWAAAEMPDGRVSVGGGAGGLSVRTPADAISLTSNAPAQVVDGRNAIGWRGLCTCGWQGPLRRRVPDAAAADPARRLVFYAVPNIWADPPPGVENAIRDEWDAHLPSPEVAAVAARAAAARRAGEDLDEAVRLARVAGRTWAAIGDAAGMTRQGAHDRWGSRWPSAPAPPAGSPAALMSTIG